MTFWAQSLYLNSPSFLQTLALNLYALNLHHQRFGKRLENLLRWLDETEHWSSAELISYQEEKLRLLIKYA
ncbi:MAG: hypothetical protein QXH91_05960, partial [Candidatus Bathyarchaeia archaeon]